MSARSVVGRRWPSAGLLGMRPSRTAALRAEDRKPCLLLMVLPEAPAAARSWVHFATCSRVSAVSGSSPSDGPMSFFKYAIKSGSELKARTAGLEGQWLIASSSLEMNLPMASVDGEQVLLVELWGELNSNSKLKQQMDAIHTERNHTFGALTIWCGQCHLQLMGDVHPRIEFCSATLFPNVPTLKEALSSEKPGLGLIASNPYLIYIAS